MIDLSEVLKELQPAVIKTGVCFVSIDGKGICRTSGTEKPHCAAKSGLAVTACSILYLSHLQILSQVVLPKLLLCSRAASSSQWDPQSSKERVARAAWPRHLGPTLGLTFGLVSVLNKKAGSVCVCVVVYLILITC